MPLTDDQKSYLIAMYQGIVNDQNVFDAAKKKEFLNLIVEVKKRNLSDADLNFLKEMTDPLSDSYKQYQSHKPHGGKRRRTCRKRILNKNMKSMHKSMHRGRSGKRSSFRKY
jgi:hypothetical protein